MRIVAVVAGQGRDVEVVVHDPDATVADVWRALGVASASDGDVRLADLDLRDGDDLPNLPRDRGALTRDGAARSLGVAVVGGLGAGGTVPLRPGERVVVGRSAGAQVIVDDPAVAPLHATVTVAADRRSVEWRDLPGSTGSWVVADDGTEVAVPVAARLLPGTEVRVGGSRLAVRPGTSRSRRRGRRAHNRPPRAVLPPLPPRLEAPTPPLPPGAPLPLGVVTVVAPLAMAALMVVVLGNPAFALFALLSPVLAVGTHLEGRRRHRTGGRRDAARWQAELDRHRHDLAVVARAERRRRRALTPDPAEVVARTVGPSPRLWERRPDHDDWLRLGVGTGADGPVTVDLGVVGVVGRDRRAALAVARSLLLQAAVHHGPADLGVEVTGGDDWDWTKWLRPTGSAAVLVVDGDWSSVRRRLWRSAGIVIARSAAELPAVTTAIVDIDAGTVFRPADGTVDHAVRLDGTSEATARAAARRLAGVDDPDLDPGGAGLPDRVRLRTLLDDVAPSPAAATPIGVAEDGPLVIDLDADGPHALIAGTTGSGKSELLRTLVAGLAARLDPDHLTFVLVDFKGGSAFDACARLPHVVGFVTDLDAALAERALRCLEAELRHRERRLREAGATDLRAYAGADPLPRLVVVIDEFATLKAELPDFVDALVDVAQRGRSLGVHLVLATQRPAGAVSDAIKANTDLRIALRVQERSESIDVLDAPDAAELPRSRPGRACVRFGPGAVVAMQTALVTTRPAPVAAGPVEVRPFRRGERPPPVDIGEAEGPTDLDRLVDACVASWAGRPAPRRPWPDPLPGRLDLLPGPAVGLLDDPDRQRQEPFGWDPGTGHVLLPGIGGSGTTTTALAVVRALAATHAPADLQVVAIDHGAGGLAPLAGLPHVGAVLVATDLERQARLVRHLRAELDRRRTHGRAGAPSVVVVIDGIASFRAAFDDVAGMAVLDGFARLIADGTAVGIHLVLAGGLPSAMAATIRHRWVHRTVDPIEAGRAATDLPPGRFIDGATGRHVQVAAPAEGWAAAFAAVAEQWPTANERIEVRTLPPTVPLDDLGPADLGRRPWAVPLGLADHDLGPAVLPLHEGDHVLVAGPARSGRTTTLATIAASVRHAGVAVVAGRRSWLGEVPGVVVHSTLADALATAPAFLLVDDAEDVDGELPADVDTHVVAAGRAEALRTQYGHWTRVVRRSRLGVLLRPDADLDGDLLGVALPRRPPAPFVPGRGYLVVDGEAQLVQVAASRR